MTHVFAHLHVCVYPFKTPRSMVGRIFPDFLRIQNTYTYTPPRVGIHALNNAISFHVLQCSLDFVSCNVLRLIDVSLFSKIGASSLNYKIGSNYQDTEKKEKPKSVHRIPKDKCRSPSITNLSSSKPGDTLNFEGR